MLSDHSLIVATFNIINRRAADKSRIKRRPWRSFDYDAFAADLEESELILDPPTNVNELFACYDETLIRLLDKHAPLRKLKVKSKTAWKAQFIKQKVLHQQKFVSHWLTAISSCQSDPKVRWSKLRPLLPPEPGSTLS